MDPVVRTEDDGILVVELNRPQARNAIDDALSVAFAEALDDLDARDDLGAAVVTGAGGTFCAGMDLKAFAAAPPADAERALARVVRRQARKPVIAAIEGFAVGGGLELALTCDLIVCATDARLGLPEVRHGLVPSGGGLVRLPRRLPFGVALEMALTGAMLDATRAHALGLVNQVVAGGGALQAAIDVARAVTANGPLAVAASKRLVWDQLDAAWERQDEVARAVNASEEAREGVRAFAQKRPPVWTRRSRDQHKPTT